MKAREHKDFDLQAARPEQCLATLLSTETRDSTCWLASDCELWRHY